MATKIAGMWGFATENATHAKGMWVNTTGATRPSLWFYIEHDGVQEWRKDYTTSAGSVAMVRTNAKAYALAWNGSHVDDHDMDTVTSEIGAIPEAVRVADYRVHYATSDTDCTTVELCESDSAHGWKASVSTASVSLTRDVSFLSPGDYEHPETFEDVKPDYPPMPELDGHTIVEFAETFGNMYEYLAQEDPSFYRVAVDDFDNGAYPQSVLTAFNKYREDIVSSDRESAAFMLTLNAFTHHAKAVEPEPVTAEIPEVPPMVESHKVVRTSAKVRKVHTVVIPGGKAVKEMPEVFGAYSHKPRGFRDSRGRRVAYVAFDGTSGVVAYRDYYTQGADKQLEQEIADYLKSHGLTIAA